MSAGILKLIEDSLDLANKGRIMPALEGLNLARSRTEIPFRRLFLTFNIGVLYWDKLGDGIAAKSEFMAAASFEAPASDHDNARVLRANALESLMLSASSFDEFDKFSVCLQALAPDAPILAGLIPVVSRMRDRGEPWSDVMVRLAMSNYNRNDPAQDRGRYGVAKSTYQILLNERRQQRLSREDWRLAIFEYCALSLRMAGDCTYLRGGDADDHSPDEFLPILIESLPIVDEYLATYTGDDEISETRDRMDFLIQNLRRRWVVTGVMEPREIRRKPEQVDSMLRYRCRKCHARIEDPIAPCPHCHHVSPANAIFSLVLIASVASGWLAWHLLISWQWWRRGMFACVTALFTLTILGRMFHRICLAFFRDKEP